MSQQAFGEAPKKLYRSRADRMLAGVCGGLAQYLNLDSTIVRILWILITLLWGVGLFLYIAAIFIVPENPEEISEEETSTSRLKGNDKTLFWGGLLIVIGIILLMNQLGIFYAIHFWSIPWQLIWAVFLILIGAFLLMNRKSVEATEAGEDTSSGAETVVGRKQIYRPREDRMLAGVCAGLARYFDIDVTIVRLIYVLLTFASIGVGIIAYIVMIFAFPEEPDSTDITNITGE